MLSSCRRVAVRGGAGTGKTLLALEKARRLAREGFRTLLTCYNRPLAEHLQKVAGVEPNLKIANFHRLCENVVQNWGVDISVQRKKNNEWYYDVFLPDEYRKVVESHEEERYDAIVADEGQDFKENYWIALEYAFREGSDILYIFYDDHQSLYHEKLALPEECIPLSLTKNLRNTRSIHKVAQPFYGDPDLSCGGPEGRRVKFVEIQDNERAPKEIEHQLQLLIEKHGVSPREIAILTGRGKERSSIRNLERLGRYQLRNDIDEDSNRPLIETIYRFKGLEIPIAILVEMEERLDRNELFYVGLTRARSHLIVVGTKEVLKRVKSAASELNV